MPDILELALRAMLTGAKWGSLDGSQFQKGDEGHEVDCCLHFS